MPTVAEGNRCADGMWPHCNGVRVSAVTPIIIGELSSVVSSADCKSVGLTVMVVRFHPRRPFYIGDIAQRVEPPTDNR